jgi:hypothetical protein
MWEIPVRSLESIAARGESISTLEEWEGMKPSVRRVKKEERKKKRIVWKKSNDEDRKGWSLINVILEVTTDRNSEHTRITMTNNAGGRQEISKARSEGACLSHWMRGIGMAVACHSTDNRGEGGSRMKAMRQATKMSNALEGPARALAEKIDSKTGNLL